METLMLGFGKSKKAKAVEALKIGIGSQSVMAPLRAFFFELRLIPTVVNNGNYRAA